MKWFVVHLLLITTIVFSSTQQHRASSAPYISGDSFRTYCNFSFDELNNVFSPSEVRQGNTIFVKTDYLKRFFNEIHPFITSRYILVSHNSDDSAPGPFTSYLNEDKIIAWFAQNTDARHPKLHPIPIGIANRCWPHGNIDIVKNQQTLLSKNIRNIFLYMNFRSGTYPTERNLVAQLFQEKPYCLIASPKPYELYLQDLARSKFVLSPRGNGLDTHRTWESLLLGAIPIVHESCLDPMYDNLPVLIIKDWNAITPEFLQDQYEKICAKSYQVEKLYINYWIDLIDSYKNK